MYYHIIYKTTCLVNDKIYIGVHSTKNLNDGYYGSGKLLNRAIKKYGIENFKTEVLEFFNSKEDAYQKERLIVNENFIKNENTYNINIGGNGSFYHINSNKELDQGMSFEDRKLQRKNASLKGGNSLKEKLANDKKYQKEHLLRLETNRRKIKEMNLPNPALSYRWVTDLNTKEQKYVHITEVDDYIQQGWIKGRKGGWGKSLRPKY
jgi:hypothetical protein